MHGIIHHNRPILCPVEIRGDAVVGIGDLRVDIAVDDFDAKPLAQVDLLCGNLGFFIAVLHTDLQPRTRFAKILGPAQLGPYLQLQRATLGRPLFDILLISDRTRLPEARIPTNRLRLQIGQRHDRFGKAATCADLLYRFGIGENVGRLRIGNIGVTGPIFGREPGQLWRAAGADHQHMADQRPIRQHLKFVDIIIDNACQNAVILPDVILDDIGISRRLPFNLFKPFPILAVHAGFQGDPNRAQVAAQTFGNRPIAVELGADAALLLAALGKGGSEFVVQPTTGQPHILGETVAHVKTFFAKDVVMGGRRFDDDQRLTHLGHRAAFGITTQLQLVWPADSQGKGAIVTSGTFDWICIECFGNQRHTL